MEIEFNITEEEHAEFIKSACIRLAKLGKINKNLFAINICEWIAIGFGFAALIKFYEVNNGLNFYHLNFAVISLIVGGIIIFLSMLYKARIHIKHSLNKDGHMLKKQTVLANNESICFNTIDTKQSFNWSAVLYKECTQNLILLYIDNNQALIIPKRAFSNTDEMNMFMKLIESKSL